MLAKLAEAKTPVLATYTPQEKVSIDLLRAKMPAATVVIFEGAGHALFVDDPERFNATLQQFLSSLPSKGAVVRSARPRTEALTNVIQSAARDWVIW